MPQRNKPGLAVRRHTHRDPLSSCLDADGTYICTAYNSRCYIIQKVTPTVTPNLNPDADVFESKTKPKETDSYEIVDSEFPPLEGSLYMNGDVAKVPPGAVLATTPESHASPTTDFSLLNGITDQLDSYSDGGALPVGGQAPPDPVTPDSNSSQSLPIDQLKQMLSSQLEYYFSRENLANDTYLLSQMDNDQYVPIWTVANFNQVKKLTTDIKLITEVLRESPNVQVDDEGQKVRPNHKRCIVILREIPENTPIDEVKGLFSGKGCPKLISCEFAHNNSWYVTFENDEDAHKAYLFLREEVREFQGKPIMARIKAKPMNRLPMPAVGPGMVAMKNGYRTPPATAASTNVYDPTSAYPPGGQQRFVFTNGSSMAPNVNYTTNQVQIYFQQQPFYPPSMLPTWGPSNTPAYFDIGSVFSVNGLAPQGSFAKTHPNRFAPRRRRVISGGGLEQRTTLSDSSLIRAPGVVKPLITTNSGSGIGKLDTSGPSSTGTPSTSVKSHYYTRESTSQSQDGPDQRIDQDDLYSSRPTLNKDPPPARYRRRRKEDEIVIGHGAGSPGPQFDLEADAFPPLPGLDQPHYQNLASSAPVSLPVKTAAVAAGGSIAVATPPLLISTQPEQTSAPAAPLLLPEAAPLESPSLDQTPWIENRLSDVVKGTAKGKSFSTNNSNGVKEKEGNVAGSCLLPLSSNICVGGSGCRGGAVAVPPPPSSPRLSSSLMSSPPLTPDKTVPGSAVSTVKAPVSTDKLKTDDYVINGSGEGGSAPGAASPMDTVLSNEPKSYNNALSPSASAPVAATTSTSSPLPDLPTSSAHNLTQSQPASAQNQSDFGVTKLSYAQVAQHHKEKAEREKQQMLQQQQVSSATQQVSTAVISAPPVTHAPGGSTNEDEAKKDLGYHQSKSEGLPSRGRGGTRGGSSLRRRDNFPRFNSRQRSPK